VVVALALGALEHLSNDGKTLVGGGDFLQVCLNFLVGWLLLVVLLSIVGNKDLAGLVRVKFARLLAEGLGQLVLGGAGLDTEEIVEGDIGAVCFGHFVTDTEDFVVCRKLSASSS